MSYKQSLLSTGHTVLEYAEFGDYSGSWYSIVAIKDYSILVGGQFGSCTGCDSFLAEFEYDLEPGTPEYEEKLKSFGLKLLNNPLSVEVELKQAISDSAWDLDSVKKSEWLSRVKNTFFIHKMEKLLNE